MVTWEPGREVPTEEFGLVAIYSVGVLSAIQYDFTRLISRGKKGPRRSRIAQVVRYLRYQLKRRDFRACRNAFNGYLAEPIADRPIGRCGSGWTKRRALRSLYRHARRQGLIQ
jgi:hypothetical protein